MPRGPAWLDFFFRLAQGSPIDVHTLYVLVGIPTSRALCTLMSNCVGSTIAGAGKSPDHGSGGPASAFVGLFELYIPVVLQHILSKFSKILLAAVAGFRIPKILRIRGNRRAFDEQLVNGAMRRNQLSTMLARRQD